MLTQSGSVQGSLFCCPSLPGRTASITKCLSFRKYNMEFLLRVQEITIDPDSVFQFQSVKDFDGAFESHMQVNFIVHKCNENSLQQLLPNVKTMRDMNLWSLSIVGLYVATPLVVVDDVDSKAWTSPERGNVVACCDMNYRVDAYIRLSQKPFVYWDTEKQMYYVQKGMSDVLTVLNPVSTLYDVMYAKTTEATMLMLDSAPCDNDVIQYMKRTKYTGVAYECQVY